MKKIILIVDDDTSILRSLSRVLERNGYAVDTAENAGDALDKMKSRHYDLALIDVILPDMKGTDLLAQARTLLQRTVKFIITGYPSAEAGAKARDYGADAFILKPIKMQELLSVIQTFLNENEEQPYLNKEEESLALSNVRTDINS